MTPPAKPFFRQLYFWVLLGMLAGIVIGSVAPAQSPLKLSALGIEVTFRGTDLKPLSDAFIRVIRMMIAPIIFTTVVTGIAGMGTLKRLGRIGLKSVVYFEVMTTIALILGWIVAAVLRPGAGMNIDVTALDVKDIQQALSAAQRPHGVVDFLLNIIPETIVGAFAKPRISFLA